MGSIGQPERATQNRIIALFRDEFITFDNRSKKAVIGEGSVITPSPRAGTTKHESHKQVQYGYMEVAPDEALCPWTSSLFVVAAA